MRTEDTSTALAVGVQRPYEAQLRVWVKEKGAQERLHASAQSNVAACVLTTLSGAYTLFMHYL